MVLEWVEISAVRNIEQAQLAVSPALNVVIGPNGSGKTSLLEAIHLACLGRSFRTVKTTSVIRHGAEAALVFVRMRIGGQERRVGIRKAKTGESEIRIDGGKGSVAEMARLAPTQVIAPGSQILVEGGPRYRRGFLDWGAFHVEHTFNDTWQRFMRSLRQRNAALRAGLPARAVEVWNDALVEAGEAVTAGRVRFVQALGARAPALVEELLGETVDLELRFRSGWKESETLAEAFERGLDRDREGGFTAVGPQRAELAILSGGLPVAERLSRGQQKLLVIALRLAQIDVVQEVTGQQCVVLVDDLPAELDRERRVRVMELLGRRNVQAFVTGTDTSLVEGGEWVDRRTFHVEHGRLSPA